MFGFLNLSSGETFVFWFLIVFVFVVFIEGLYFLNSQKTKSSVSASERLMASILVSYGGFQILSLIGVSFSIGGTALSAFVSFALLPAAVVAMIYYAGVDKKSARKYLMIAGLLIGFALTRVQL